MSVFKKQYAKIYDFVYQDKDSEKETEVLEEIFKEHQVKKILDIGCGTGRHSTILAQKGYDVLGIDNSLEMINIAKEKIRRNNLRFKHCDILKFKKQEIFDACICLFDTIGYLKKKNIFKFFRRTSKHLQKNGLLLVDYWDTENTEKCGISKVLFKVFRAEKKILFKLAYSKFERPKVKITWRFFSLPDFKFFKEIHIKNTFDFEFLNKMATSNNFEVLEVIKLSDINSLLIFQKL